MAGVDANYGLVETASHIEICSIKGTTAMSDCNKKAIHNKFEAAPRCAQPADNAFDVATGDNSNWEFPNLAC